MWPALVRNIILPAHEAVLGRRTFAIFRELEGARDCPIEELRAECLGKLQALLIHAGTEIPYWRQRLPDAVLTASASDLELLLQSLPVLTRTDIRRNREKMRWPRAPGRVLVHRSSGTTDDNLIFYFDRERQAWGRAQRMWALSRHGISPGDKQIHFYPNFGSGGPLNGLKNSLRACRDRLTNDPVFDLRPMKAAVLDAALDLIDSYRPAVLVGYPSWLYRIARRKLQLGTKPRGFRPRVVLSTGELLYDFQRGAILEAFGVPAVEEYGSQDVGLIASEDSRGHWRVHHEQVIVEVLRDFCPAAPGQPGEVVVTNLCSRVMPFVRYATGDVVVQPSGRHSEHGVQWLQIPPIEGRSSDLLVATNGSLVCNRIVVDTLVRELGSVEFSLHQTSPGEVTCLTLRDGGVAGSAARAESVLRELLGNDLRVQWQVGSAFRELKSGKRRYVCSTMAHALLAHDKEAGFSLARAWPQTVLS